MTAQQGAAPDTGRVARAPQPARVSAAVGFFNENTFMDNIEAQVQEVYEGVGLAIALTQRIEQRLAVLLACATDFGATACTTEQYQSVLSRLLAYPLGRLVSELRTTINLREDLAERLKSAVAVRNRLAHRYFRERADEFMSPDGRRAMLDELDQITSELDELDDLIERWQLAWLGRGILSRETLIQCVQGSQEEA